MGGGVLGFVEFACAVDGGRGVCLGFARGGIGFRCLLEVCGGVEKVKDVGDGCREWRN